MTAAGRRVLDALRDITVDGWPASVDEVRARVGHASKSTTYEALLTLERQGLVVRHPRNSKGGFMPVRPVGVAIITPPTLD